MEQTKVERVRIDGRLAGDETALIKLQFTDLFGRQKTVEMTKGQGEKAIREGYAVNPCAVDGKTGGNCEGGEGHPVYLQPDLNTYRALPWDSGQKDVAGVICDIVNQDGSPYPNDTRGLFKAVISRAEKMGLRIYFDFQCEFYLFHTDDEGRPTTITHEAAGHYDAGPIDLAESVRRDMMYGLAEAGMEVESAHHGRTPGQHCFLLPARYGVEAADFVQTFKTAVKRIAKRHGLHAAFIPKPLAAGAGCGLHVGITIFDEDGNSDKELDGYFRNGILMHLWEMMIFTNPLINSYKRLAAERKKAARPEHGPVMEDAGSFAARCSRDREGRSFVKVYFPDPAANPYLALAALAAAGLDGIGQKITSDACGKRFHLPETLGEAIADFDNYSFAKSVFGETLCRLYHDGKVKEWERFCAYVTDWELDEYLCRY